MPLRSAGWAPALLPSRGGVIARPRFNPRTLIREPARRDWEIEEVGEVRGSQLASRRNNSGAPATLTTGKVRVLPPCQFFGHTTSGRSRYQFADEYLEVGPTSHAHQNRTDRLTMPPWEIDCLLGSLSFLTLRGEAWRFARDSCWRSCRYSVRYS